MACVLNRAMHVTRGRSLADRDIPNKCMHQLYNNRVEDCKLRGPSN